MMAEKKLELVHFQLTKNCNLRCWFCGQWGKQGFFSDSQGESMNFEAWLAVIDQLCHYRDEMGISPDIILWGGEPLTCSFFDEIVSVLRERQFRLGLVTNGTLIDKHAEILKSNFNHIYVSIDGTRDVHDKIRGKGVYERVARNLELLRGTLAKISIMSVLSEDNVEQLEEMVAELLKLNCDEVILQEMIGLSESEIEQYKKEMNRLDISAEYIDSWFMQKLPKINREKIKQVCDMHPGQVCYIPHGDGEPCKSPCHHIHIAWNGNLLYCTDFYDFSAGNVKNESILRLFHNEKSEKFRALISENRCSTCLHCSWRKSTTFDL